MTPQQPNAGSSPQAVAVIPASLVDALRRGLLGKMSESSQRLSTITNQREVNTEAYYPELARLDATRQLLDTIGVSGRGERPQAIPITEADHPDLILGSLEASYRQSLDQRREIPSTGSKAFSQASKAVAELGEFVAALRERLARPNRGKQT